jgi:hypothetical protein
VLISDNRATAGSSVWGAGHAYPNLIFLTLKKDQPEDISDDEMESDALLSDPVSSQAEEYHDASASFEFNAQQPSSNEELEASD